MELGLGDKVCVVTGSTAGIGRETARLLAEEGARVVTAGRRPEGPGIGEELHVSCDLAEAAGVDTLIAKAIESFGRIDVLVNNVGIAYQAAFDDLLDEQWDDLWQLNVMSYVRALRAVLPGMRERGRA